MTRNKNNNNYTFKFVKNGKEVVSVRTHKLGRILHHIQRAQWSKHDYKAYFRVYYGTHKDVFGKKSSFYNSGWYTTKKDFDLAYKAFLEEGR